MENRYCWNMQKIKWAMSGYYDKHPNCLHLRLTSSIVIRAKLTKLKSIDLKLGLMRHLISTTSDIL